MRITSESVLEGHPDKVCDQISDAILDAYLAQDQYSHVAVETMISQNLLVIAGEVRSQAHVNLEQIAKEVLKKIGYDHPKKGFDYHSCVIVKNVHFQSTDISIGVDQSLEAKRGAGDSHQQGAGDQGIMYGYATDETEDYLPVSIHYAHRLARRLAEVRKKGQLAYLYPDGKTQVTVSYDEKGKVDYITDIVISAQHADSVDQSKIREDLWTHVIEPEIPNYLRNEHTRVFVNPTGRFTIGGPEGDTGLTGRKIIVDTYGGVIPHGGGAFSGKDPSKVDRSAAYMARYISKNIVAAGIAKRCQISLSYAIGVAAPVSVDIDTFGSSRLSNAILARVVQQVFDLTPSGIIRDLQLLRPIYQATARYGHFKDGANLPWESLDKVTFLQEIEHRLLDAR